MLLKPAPQTAAAPPAAANVSSDRHPLHLGETRRLLVVCLIAMVMLSAMVISVICYSANYINSTISDMERIRAQNALSFALERGDAFDTTLVTRLALEQGLDGAHVVRLGESSDGETVLPLLDGSGRGLAWRSRQLGTEIFSQMAPIRITATTLFFMVVAYLLRRLFQIATELEGRRREAHELARRDQLTGLGNRLAFDEAMAAGLAGNRRIGLVSLDLDDFKTVNDTLGHGAGDELLQRIAGRLRSAARADDVVARIGGDEFTLIRVGVATRADLDELARDIDTALGAPFNIGSHALDVHASIGMALAPEDGVDPQTLMRHADLALYGAKRSGRQGSHVDRLRAVG